MTKKSGSESYQRHVTPQKNMKLKCQGIQVCDKLEKIIFNEAPWPVIIASFGTHIS
jgi:hypothetical protein